MRYLKTILASAGMLLFTGATAMAATLQDVKVDVHTPETNTTWYASPTWLAIGGIAVLLIIVLVVMAARGRRGTSTTVIR